MRFSPWKLGVQKLTQLQQTKSVNEQLIEMFLCETDGFYFSWSYLTAIENRLKQKQNTVNLSNRKGAEFFYFCFLLEKNHILNVVLHR